VRIGIIFGGWGCGARAVLPRSRRHERPSAGCGAAANSIRISSWPYSTAVPPSTSVEPTIPSAGAKTRFDASGPLLDGYLDRLGDHEMVPMGSSLKFCIVAEGRADLYPRLGPTSEWDTAAGHALLTAAGGSVTTLAGDPLLYGKAMAKFINPNFVAWGRLPPAPTG